MVDINRLTLGWAVTNNIVANNVVTVLQNKFQQLVTSTVQTPGFSPPALAPALAN